MANLESVISVEEITSTSEILVPSMSQYAISDQIGHWSKVCKKGPKTGSFKEFLSNAKVNAMAGDSDYYSSVQ